LPWSPPPAGLGARLRELRRACELSREELAEKAGISHNLIVKLEQGNRTSARIDSLARLAAALGAGMADFWLPAAPAAPAALGCGSGRWPPARSDPRPIAEQLAVMAAEIRELRAAVSALTPGRSLALPGISPGRGGRAARQQPSEF